MVNMESNNIIKKIKFMSFTLIFIGITMLFLFTFSALNYFSGNAVYSGLPLILKMFGPFSTAFAFILAFAFIILGIGILNLKKFAFTTAINLHLFNFGFAVVLFILLLMNPGILNSAKTNYNLFYFSSSNLNVGKTVHFYFGEAFLFMFAVINFVILNYIYSNKIDSYFIKKEFNVDNVMHEVVGDDTPRF